MKKAILISRIVLGVVYTLFSLMFFLQLMPAAELNGPAGNFMGALFNSGYMMYLVKAIELICGIALISGQFVSLSTVIIFPITLNIFLFHALLDPKNIAVSLILLLLNLFVAYGYKENYALMLMRK